MQTEEQKKHLGRIGLGVILLVASIMLARKDKLAGQGFMLLAGGIIVVGVVGYNKSISNAISGPEILMGDGDVPMPSGQS